MSLRGIEEIRKMYTIWACLSHPGEPPEALLEIHEGNSLYQHSCKICCDVIKMELTFSMFDFFHVSILY